MADVDAISVTVICHHCEQSTPLTRPDINIRASSIPDTLGCTGLAPSQIEAVNETVAATLADISELDLTISRLKAATQELERKRTALQRFANNHKSLLNPITRLPTEVLSQIFQQCLIVSWLEKGLHPNHPFDPTPLMIASVSRHWRNVALSTPRLWSALSLTLRPKDAKRHISLVSMWLSRSGNTPLSIYLRTHTNIRINMRKLMDVFASKSSRWRHIHFNLPLSMIRSLSSRSIKLSLPMLEMLKIEFWDSYFPSPMDVFAHAPHLRDFTAGQDVTARSLTLPWNQLRNINIMHYMNRSQNVFDLLALASDVEHAEFRAASGYHEPPHAQAPGSVKLHNLQSLTAIINVFDNEWDEMTLFAVLHVPNIRELSLSTDRSSDSLGRLWTSLCSRTSLETLRLHSDSSGHRLDGKNVVQILQAFKQLRVLEVPVLNFISTDFLESFAQRSPSGTPTLGPNLQTLLFHSNSEGVIYLESLANALQLRCPPGSQAVLNNVTILCLEGVNIASNLETFRASPWWDRLREVGINVQLQSWSSYVKWWL